jgi:hypothetical protein
MAKPFSGLTHVSDGGSQQFPGMAGQIRAAMSALAQPHGLEVLVHLDLGGASVVNSKMEAYVYPRKTGGFVVDVWRPGASDAVQKPMGDLGAAVAFAVQSVIAKRRRA